MKKGLSPTKAFIWYFISIIAGAIFIGIQSLESQDLRQILIQEGLMAFVMFVLLLLIASIGNVVRAVVWNKLHYRRTPLAFLFIMKCKGVKFLWDFFVLGNIYFPLDLVDEMKDDYDEDKLKSLVLKVEKLTFLLTLSIFVALLIAAVVCKSLVLLSSTLIALATFLIVSNTQGHSFHGALVRMRYISQGDIIYYFGLNALLAGNSFGQLFDAFEERELENENKKTFLFHSLLIFQEYMVSKCLGNKETMSAYFETYLAKEMIFKNPFNEWFITPERVKLLKLYLYYNVICQKKDKLNLIKEYIAELLEKEGDDFYKGLIKEYEFYYALASMKRTDTDQFICLKPDEYLRWFKPYIAMKSNIETKIKIIIAAIEDEVIS